LEYQKEILTLCISIYIIILCINQSIRTIDLIRS
jgi:hypothetical protein